MAGGNLLAGVPKAPRSGGRTRAPAWRTPPALQPALAAGSATPATDEEYNQVQSPHLAGFHCGYQRQLSAGICGCQAQQPCKSQCLLFQLIYNPP